MKAITISQPWASLIRDREKFVENRSWQTSYRGPLAIHAGSGTQYLTKSELAAYPTGQVIAVAQLVACVHIGLIHKNRLSESLVPGAAYTTWKMVAEHQHTEGEYCWVLEGITAIEPIAVKGKQGLWDFDLPASTE